jgi:uncharacterized protein (TIGR02145 family)
MEIEKGSWTDPRDGTSYRTARIGGFVWLAENLKFKHPKAAVYKNNPDNCVIYGRLYDWEAAMESCPKGWRLPIEEDWTLLCESVGGLAVSARHLAALKGDVLELSMDTHGFAAMAGGLGLSDGQFMHMGYRGYWWLGSEHSQAGQAKFRVINFAELSLRDGIDGKSYKFSVRLVREPED